MKPPNDPGWNTARAICETTDAVALGAAWTCTARYERPRNIVIVSKPRIPSVFAAFFPCGWRKALTPFAIASTPVRAVDPEENARRRMNVVTAPVPAASGFGTTALCRCPEASSTSPTASTARIATMKAYVGSANSIPDSRTPRRFASTITPRQASESPTRCELSDGRERGDGEDPRRDRDGDGEHVVGQQGRGRDEAGRCAEVLARDDVRAAARLVDAHRLPVREDHDREQARDRDREREHEVRRLSPAAPTSTTSASSVAYAFDESGSEAKIGSASHFGSSVSCIWPVCIGRPTSTRRRRLGSSDRSSVRVTALTFLR